MVVKLSIIIPTLNEANYLPIILESIKRQTYKDYEIIVSDGSSDDDTVAVAHKYGCRIIIDERRGPGYGRNRGAEIARGKYLLFLDADVFFPSEDFLEEFMSAIKKKRMKLGTCLVEPYPARAVDKIIGPITNAWILTTARISPFASGFFIFVSKDIHEKIGGFNEKLLIAEDRNYAKRAMKYAPFKVVTRLKIYYSTRRLEKEGRLSLYPRYLLMTLYRALIGEIDSPVFRYNFGDFDPPPNNYEEILREIKQKKYLDVVPVQRLIRFMKQMGKEEKERRRRRAS